MNIATYLMMISGAVTEQGLRPFGTPLWFCIVLGVIILAILLWALLSRSGESTVAEREEAARMAPPQPAAPEMPVMAEPEPMMAEPEPMMAEPEPMMAEPEMPVMAEPEPMMAEPEKLVIAAPEMLPMDEPEPMMAEPEKLVIAAPEMLPMDEPAEMELDPEIPAMVVAEPMMAEPETRMAELELEPAGPDDLSMLEGIGPKIQEVLAAAGITTFAQLAQTDVATLDKIVREDAGITIAHPDTWPRQAALAAAGDMEGLQTYMDRLKGGREVEPD